MRIDEILEERRPVFSFEFFPPKDKQGMTLLKGALDVALAARSRG